tara:strand:- start:997 stop:1614 length:618 start_codon:yes stop_codon:yes gene_type:complete
MDYFLLGLFWILWCAIHSGMICLKVTEYLKLRLGNYFRFYRLIYNFVAIVTIIPVISFGDSIEGSLIFQWEGYLLILQILLLAISIFLFIAGAKHYDIFQFLGIRQIWTRKSHSVITKGGELKTDGILSVTRHPWYLAAILLIWSREFDLSVLITNTILTLYLIIGTLLEEQKLFYEYGESYRKYQKKVSMLIPFKYFLPGLVLK